MEIKKILKRKKYIHNKNRNKKIKRTRGKIFKSQPNKEGNKTS
jgi:hypothetical protein